MDELETPLWDEKFVGDRLRSGEWVPLEELMDESDDIGAWPGWETEETQVESVGRESTPEPPATAQSKKDTRNADACRRHREKRKREVEDLKLRNENLEKHRDLYLARIADLQMNVDSLRMNNQVDLTKENELLRIEIKKHKAFIMNLIDAASQPPSMTAEEQYRMLKSGLESGKCHVLGMCYASLVDSSWESLEPIIVDGITVHVKYQFLPHGAEPKFRKRINFRMDYDRFPIPPEQYQRLVWDWFMDIDFINDELYKEFEEIDKVKRKAYNILPPSLREVANKMDDEMVSCWRYEEIGKNMVGHEETLQSTFASVGCTGELFSAGLLLGRDDYEGPVSARISCSTSMSVPFLNDTSGEQSSKEDKVRVVECPVVKGSLCYSVPGEETSSYLTVVGSIPLDPDLFKGLQIHIDGDTTYDNAFVGRMLHPEAVMGVRMFSDRFLSEQQLGRSDCSSLLS